MRARREQEAAGGRAIPPTDAGPLAGRRVLVVEDEALLALDLEMTLSAAGAEVLGPFIRLSDALAAAGTMSVDVAVLDVMLGRQRSDALAELLLARGVAILFHSGHADGAALAARFPGAGHCPKPCTSATIVRRLVEVVEA